MISQASDRRSFLRSFVVGSTLMPALINDLLADSNKRDPLSPKNPQFPAKAKNVIFLFMTCLLYTSPSPRDRQKSRMPSSA